MTEWWTIPVNGSCRRWPYRNQSRGPPLAAIRSSRVNDAPGPLFYRRLAALGILCDLGRVFKQVPISQGLSAAFFSAGWLGNRREAHAIQSAHVDLERERIRTRIVSAAGSGGGFDGVVAADIVGGDAHADMQDQDRGSDYASFNIARGVATTVLMHSFGGMERRGGTPQELRLGTVAPNVGPEYVTEVLGSLEETLWYVHREGDSLSFQTRPNIYRVIAQRADEQSQSTVADRLRTEVDGVIGTAPGFRVIPWAGADGQIPDNPDPTIAVLDPRYAISESGNGGTSADEERVRQLWDRLGGGLRQWRNALVLVAPDREFWGRAEHVVREVLAYESVVGSAGRKSIDLSNLEVRDLESRSRRPRGTVSRRAWRPPIGGCSTQMTRDSRRYLCRCPPPRVRSRRGGGGRPPVRASPLPGR